MPKLPDYATTTAPVRDRFAYVTYNSYRDPSNPSGIPTSYNTSAGVCIADVITHPGMLFSIYGYHIGVHLDTYNQALDTDEDCKDLSTSPSPDKCYVFNVENTETCPVYPNKVNGMIGTSMFFDFNGADTGTTTCSGVNDCVLDFSGHTEQ